MTTRTVPLRLEVTGPVVHTDAVWVAELHVGERGLWDCTADGAVFVGTVTLCPPAECLVMTEYDPPSLWQRLTRRRPAPRVVGVTVWYDATVTVTDRRAAPAWLRPGVTVAVAVSRHHTDRSDGSPVWRLAHTTLSESVQSAA